LFENEKIGLFFGIGHRSAGANRKRRMIAPVDITRKSVYQGAERRDLGVQSLAAPVLIVAML
jgi:hypothetical protein